jgi:phosphoribosylanthranilate isomerase
VEQAEFIIGLSAGKFGTIQNALAGGLKPENVKQAIEEVQPFAIDVCNGVRTNGALDRKKLIDFFKNALIDK